MESSQVAESIPATTLQNPSRKMRNEESSGGVREEKARLEVHGMGFEIHHMARMSSGTGSMNKTLLPHADGDLESLDMLIAWAVFVLQCDFRLRRVAIRRFEKPVSASPARHGRRMYVSRFHHHERF